MKSLRRIIQTLALLAFGATAALAQTGNTVYNHIPTPFPHNYPSLGYQATSTSEFGDYIILAGTDRLAATATVGMSAWAKHSTYPTMPAAGWSHPITLNIYAVDNSGTNPAVGALLGSVTQTFLIPWRPEADPTCPFGGTAWRAGDGNCYNGLAFKITFDLRSLALTLPDELIFGIAYNTNTWGYDPIGAPGPYESLNVGLDTGPATVGLDVEPDALFWNTKFGPFYSDGGAGGVGTFRRDDGWAPYSPAFQLTAVTSNGDFCKNGGWKTINRTDATPFKNQGDCVSYMKNGK